MTRKLRKERQAKHMRRLNKKQTHATRSESILFAMYKGSKDKQGFIRSILPARA